MLSPARLLILCSVLFAGCHTAEKVAVSSFRVMDAPAQYIRHRIDPETTTTTTTTTTDVSDVANPGAPVTAPTPHRSVTQPHPSSAASTTTKPVAGEPAATVQKKPASTASRAPATQPAQFPTAKPVPGKPGYVYSVDPKGGIVDVTGYKPGDKAKDPYTKQVFIVP